MSVWKPTPEELEEERLLRESLPAAYGDGPSPSPGLPAGDDANLAGGNASGAAATVVSRRPRVPAATPPAPAATPPAPAAAAAAGIAGTGAAQQRPAAAEGRRRRAQEGGQSGVRREWAGQGGPETAGGGGRGGSEDVVSTAVLEGENRDLVVRMKNELDDARLVETKMSEVRTVNDMTQDNTLPPGPAVKARLLRNEHDSKPKEGTFSDSSRRDLSETALSEERQSFLLWSTWALKIDPGGECWSCDVLLRFLSGRSDEGTVRFRRRRPLSRLSATLSSFCLVRRIL